MDIDDLATFIELAFICWLCGFGAGIVHRFVVDLYRSISRM